MEKELTLVEPVMVDVEWPPTEDELPTMMELPWKPSDMSFSSTC